MLPEISLPKFSTTIKELKKTFHFRPFMMKEERAILMAKAIGTDIEVRQTIEQVVDACLITNEKINVEELPAHIVDYLFMQMYTRSNTNILTVNFTCNANYTKYEFTKKVDEETGEEYEEENKITQQCNHESLNPMDLGAIKIFYPENFEERKVIKIDDSITLYLKAPMSKSIRNVYLMSEVNEDGEYSHTEKEREEAYENLVFESIDRIIKIEGDSEVIYTNADFTVESFGVWVDNAPKHVAEGMAEFFAEMPSIFLHTKMQCLRPECQYSTTYAITGAKSFLDLC